VDYVFAAYGTRKVGLVKKISWNLTLSSFEKN
jgi:hypothetical protein